MLGCSFAEVRRRVARRGLHFAPFGFEETAAAIATAYRAVFYGDEPADQYFGYPPDDIRNLIIGSELIWAPDGDAAFDDGSHVLQIDRSEFSQVDRI